MELDKEIQEEIRDIEISYEEMHTQRTLGTSWRGMTRGEAQELQDELHQAKVDEESSALIEYCLTVCW